MGELLHATLQHKKIAQVAAFSNPVALREGQGHSNSKTEESSV